MQDGDSTARFLPFFSVFPDRGLGVWAEVGRESVI